jgi:hypothetical protein
MARTEVEDVVARRVFEKPYGVNMGACKIGHMDIVSNTSTVQRIIVGSINLKRRTPKQREKQSGDKMSFWTMVFADIVGWARTTCIEIAQAHRLDVTRCDFTLCPQL